MTDSKIESKPSISTLELWMIAYGALCSFLIVYATSGNLIFSMCMIPAGIAGVCIAILFNKHLLEYLAVSHVSERMKIIGACVMPLVFLILAFCHLWFGNLYNAGAHTMMFGGAILIAMSQFDFHCSFRKNA